MNIYQVRTSDRLAFLRCRRKWSFSSGLRGNLTTKGTISHFWFGTGFHFALEDYFGYNRFGDPFKAFQAYDEARGEEKRPHEVYDEFMELAEGLFNYMHGWMENREEYKTVWAYGVPMVELNMRYRIPELSNDKQAVFYNYTIDRVVEDVYGNYWLMDYKTYKKADIAKLGSDTQITAYITMLEQQLGIPISGMVYWQFIKNIPQPPERLKSGKFSKSKSQGTTYKMYKKVLMDEFGEIPSEYRDIVEHFMMQEDINGDAIMRWDQVTRNDAMKRQEYNHILYQARDMINPKLPLYPNYTRDCSWDCNFSTACEMINDGLHKDAGEYLQEAFQDYKQDEEWRKDIKWPDQ